MEQQNKMEIPGWLRVILFILLLYVFFVAIGLMGGSFKLLGKGAAEALIAATSNPFTGLMIGILATSLVQSSSVTTSMTVGLVSSGALTIGGAVPIIMGANIGTSVTNTIVSMGHIRDRKEFERAFAGATVHDMFNLVTVAALLPLELMTGFLHKMGMGLAHLFAGTEAVAFKSPLKIIIKPAVGLIEEIMLTNLGIPKTVAGIIMIFLAFVMLFLSLIFIVRNMRALMLDRIEVAINRMFGANPVFAILVGMVITAIIQSSSITTSLLVPLVGAGVMSLEAAFPITVGANIGTTITALLAALAGNINGLAIAFVHLCFNVLGTVIFFGIRPLRRIPIAMARKLAHIAVNNKKLAVAYVVAVFYLTPLAIFGISSLFH